MGYRIETVDSKDKYEGLRDLWCRVFGDDPEFVDFFYRSFVEDIEGYVICNDAGKVISALTCFRCGTFRDAAGVMADRPAYDADCCAKSGGADGVPVYVSYAICTDPEYRGQGHAAALTGYVREIVTAPRGSVLHEDDERLPAAEGLGGISLVSPAEESLIGYYDRLGYRAAFTVDEHKVGTGVEGTVPDAVCDDHAGGAEDKGSEPGSGAGDTRIWGLDADGNAGFLDDEEGEAFEPELSVESVSGSMYNKYREEFLADIPHVEMNSDMMDFLRADGDGGLLVINGGDAICRVAYAGEAAVAGEAEGAGCTSDADGRKADAEARGCAALLDELLVNPQLRDFSEEIEEEIALRLAEYFGAESLVYRTPGCGYCQSMSAAAGTAEAFATGAYFGFPIE